jgi:hypothetical protein
MICPMIPFVKTGTILAVNKVYRDNKKDLYIF